MLRSDDPARERILVTGLYGSGKTHAWATIADWYRNTDTPGTFHVLDTDNTTLRTLTAYPDWEQNIRRHDIFEWEALTARTEDAYQDATADDWLIIDSIDAAWQMVQDYYTEKVFGIDSADFFFQAKVAGQKGNPMSDSFGTNWQVINKLYRKWMLQQVVHFPGHVFATSPAKQVSEQGERKEVRETFERYGVKPAGQWGLPFQLHTVLLLRSAGADQYTLTSIKDRSRDLQVGVPLVDFALTYLIGVAGWQTD